MEIGDARSRRAAALAADQERLDRVRRKRLQGRADSVWQEFQVAPERGDELREAVEAAILAMGSSGGGTAEALAGLLRGSSCPGAPGLLLGLIWRLPPEVAVAHLARLHEIGMPQAAPFGLAAGLLHGSIEPDLDKLRLLPDRPRELALWRDAQLVRAGAGPVNTPEFVAHAPMALLDDLIDQGFPPVLGGEERADPRENLYLRARTVPGELSDDQVRRIGWEDESWRRVITADPHRQVPKEAPEWARDLDAVAEGGADALRRAVDRVGGGSARLIRNLLASVETPEAWPAEVLADRSLWPVLAGLATEVEIPEVASEALTEFGAWRDLRGAHHNLMGASAWAYRAVEPHLSSETAWIREEAAAIRVYLDVRYATPGDAARLQASLTRLADPSFTHAVTRDNAAWLKHRLGAPRNSRGPLFNPYLELGVPHGAPASQCQEAWRSLRRELAGRDEELSSVNQARDMIRVIEADGAVEDTPMYVLPVHEERLFPTPCIPAPLIPGMSPLSRRTDALGPDHAAALRREAARAVIGSVTAERTT